MSEGVLITGVAGFIGSCAARRLLGEGIRMVGIDDLSSGRRSNVPSGVYFIEGDLANPLVVDQIPSGIDYILHLAGQSSGEISFDDPVADLQKNVTTTLNLIRWGIRSGCKRFVYASSMAVYGLHPDQPAAETDACQPLSCYGAAKLAAEHYLRIYAGRLPSVILRMFSVYGPGQDMENMRQGMVSIYLKMALRTGCVHVKGSLDRYRDFIYIDDVVDVWHRAMRVEGNDSYILNVGTGVRTTVESVLSEIASCVPGVSWVTEAGTAGDQHGIYAETTQLRDVLGISTFTSMKNGMKKFVEWAEQSRMITS